MPRMPGGRPTLLDQPVRTRPDGSTVTAGEQVIDRVQLGLDLQSACDSAGIARQTLHNWMLEAARLRAAVAQGRAKLTPRQTLLVEFLDAIERAQAEAEANRLAIIQRVAAGGGVITKRTVKRGPVADDAPEGTLGPVLEVTEVTETLRPEWTAAAWWLERKRGYVRPLSVEVTGAGGAPLIPQAEAARDLADSLREYLQGVEDGKAEAAAKAKAAKAAKT